LARNSGDAVPPIHPGHAELDPPWSENSGYVVPQEPRLVTWQVVFTRQAVKDAKRIARAGLRPQAEKLLTVLATNPLRNPPPYEKLVGDLAGAYSRRINVQHRLVYQVLKDRRVVKVIRMWTHYE